MNIPRSTLFCLVAGVLSLGIAVAQDAPATLKFDVASVKLNPWKDTGSGSVGVVTVRGNTLAAEHASLYDLIEYAYGLENGFQLGGGPPWATYNGKPLVSATFFQVMAQTDQKPVPDTAAFRVMLQNLLVDRFQLKVHHETKDVPVLLLTVTKVKSALRESPDDEKPSMNISGDRRMTIKATHMPMTMLARFLRPGGRTVLDRTGLTGFYDFDLVWFPDDQTAADNNDAAPGPSIFAALSDFGLKLSAANVPYDAVIIDRAEKPSEN